MAIVKWNSAIDYVKGALTKPKKQDGHSHGDYLIGTHREAATTNPNCTRAYVKPADAYDRSTPVTSDERAQRTRFAAISRAVNTRRKDLAHVAEDLVQRAERYRRRLQDDAAVPVACVCGGDRLNGGSDGSVRIARITRMQMDKNIHKIRKIRTEQYNEHGDTRNHTEAGEQKIRSICKIRTEQTTPRIGRITRIQMSKIP